LQYFYIYNYKQAKFFIDKGLKVVDIDKGKKDDIYHKFIKNEESEKVFMEWKQNKYGEKAV
jgi:hypothetical protein